MSNIVTGVGVAVVMVGLMMNSALHRIDEGEFLGGNGRFLFLQMRGDKEI